MTTPKTRVAPVQARLRNEVLTGQLPAGSKLRLAELAARTGASISVVREALIRLASEGLVLGEPQVGFRVVSVSAKDLEDLIGARLVVECETFRSAMTHGTHEWEADVIGAFHRLRRVEQGDHAGRNEEEWVAAHRFFHESLLAGCPNERLIAASMALRDAAELYRSASVLVMTAGDAQQRDAEHAALRDAAVDRDIERGVTMLGTHIRMTAKYFNPESEHQEGASPSMTSK